LVELGRTVDRVVGQAGDAVLDAAVVAFALWTVVYDVDLAADWSTSVLLGAWLSICALVALARAAAWWRDRRRDQHVATAPARRYRTRASARPWLWLVVASVAAMVTVVARSTSWPAAWSPAAAFAAASLVAHARTRGDDPSPPAAATSYAGSALAALVALGVGAVTPFTLWLSNDDVYYVNRSVWVAAHGAVPVRDTIFGNQVLPAMGGQRVPIASIEAFQGALAHAFGLAAPTVVYMLTPPIATTLAVWALWRLVRAWVPRRALLGLVVALVWVLWSTLTLTTEWNFHLVGMW
jgi:hypothetical protein